MYRLFRAVRFLFMGPVILLFLIFVPSDDGPGEGGSAGGSFGRPSESGFAWVISSSASPPRAVARGGVAALVAYFRRPPTS